MTRPKGYQHTGGKHRIIDGVAHRTPEAAKAAAVREYTRAGIAQTYAAADLAAVEVDLSQNPPARQKFTQVVASAINNDALEWIAAHARRAIDDGNTALVTNIVDLVDLKMTKERAAEWKDTLERIRKVDFLVITFADTLATKMTMPVALSIHQDRLGSTGWTYYHVDQIMRLEVARFGALADASEKFGVRRFE